MAKIQPVIVSSQEVYDYLSITPAAAAANLLNGFTTRSTWITHLMGQTAQQIVDWLGYDWTDSQQILFTFPGNNSTLMEAPSPIKTLQNLYVIDNTNPNLGVQTLSTAVITQQISPLAQWFLRNDGANWDSWSQYTLQYLQDIDPEVWNIWPQEVKTVQLEMIGLIYASSNNLDNVMGIMSFGNGLGMPIQGLTSGEFTRYLGATQSVRFRDLTPIWKDRLRVVRKISI